MSGLDHEWLKSMSASFIRKLRQVEYTHVRCVVGLPMIPEFYPYDDILAEVEARDASENKLALQAEISALEEMYEFPTGVRITAGGFVNRGNGYP
jgi:hypothetical protein